MKCALLLLIALFFVGTIVWAAFNGEWESAYVVHHDGGEYRYLIGLVVRKINLLYIVL